MIHRGVHETCFIQVGTCWLRGAIAREAQSPERRGDLFSQNRMFVFTWYSQCPYSFRLLTFRFLPFMFDNVYINTYFSVWWIMFFLYHKLMTGGLLCFFFCSNKVRSTTSNNEKGTNHTQHHNTDTCCVPGRCAFSLGHINHVHTKIEEAK